MGEERLSRWPGIAAECSWPAPQRTQLRCGPAQAQHSLRQPKGLPSGILAALLLDLGPPANAVALRLLSLTPGRHGQRLQAADARKQPGAGAPPTRRPPGTLGIAEHPLNAARRRSNDLIGGVHARHSASSCTANDTGRRARHHRQASSPAAPPPWLMPLRRNTSPPPAAAATAEHVRGARMLRSDRQ